MAQNKNALQKILPRIGVAAKRAAQDVSDSLDVLSGASFPVFLAKSIRGDYAEEELEQMRRDVYNRE